MALPRLKCLNSASRVVKKSVGMRATFSHSSIARADEEDPNRRSAAAALLRELEPPPPPRRAAPTKSSWALPSVSESGPEAAPVKLSRVNTKPTTRATERLAQFLSQTDKREQLRKAQNPQQDTKSLEQHLEETALAKSLTQQISRRWRAGDIYAPHDLSDVEMQKWKTFSKIETDVFDILKFDPKDHYQNFSIMSEYMTPMGRIKHSKETGLRPVNQRKIARSIRRIIGLGMMPSVHRHPELLIKQRRN